LPVAATRAANDTAVLDGECTLEQFRHPSPLVPTLPGIDALLAHLDPAAPALETLASLGEVVRESFTFDPAATDVSTPLADVLRLRRGVCQDFRPPLPRLRAPPRPRRRLRQRLPPHPPARPPAGPA